MEESGGEGQVSEVAEMMTGPVSGLRAGWYTRHRNRLRNSIRDVLQASQ